MSEAEVFVARTSSGRTSLLVLASLGFVVMGLWLVGWFGQPPATRRFSQDGAFWLGWITILFFGLTTLIGGARLFDRRPRIVVDAQGILWRDFSDQTIPWSRIRGWTMQDMVTTKFICLDVVDAGSFRRAGIAAIFGGANRGMGFGEAQLNVTGTDRSFSDLVDAMQRFAPA